MKFVVNSPDYINIKSTNILLLNDTISTIINSKNRIYNKTINTSIIKPSFNITNKTEIENSISHRDSFQLFHNFNPIIDKFPNHENIFIHEVAKMLKNKSHDSIVGFNGYEVKSVFEHENSFEGVNLNGKSKVRTWRDVANLVNQSYYHQFLSNHTIINKAVHIHNELKIGDLLELIHFETNKLMKQKNIKLLYENKTIQEIFLNSFEINSIPILITNSVDENWGFLSTPINTRTTKWINMTNHLLIHKSNYNTIKYLLNSKNLLLLIGSNHVDPKIGSHRKIIGLPLGLKNKYEIYKKIMKYSYEKVNKTKLLLINNSGWRDRTIINQQISKVFNYTVKNTYKLHSQSQNYDHYRDVAESVYVLCPSGLGFDTYRLYETLLLGSIPIVESNEGFDRTYTSLPVMIVRNYSEITPKLLVDSYDCYYKNVLNFYYNHLLHEYWIDLIDRAIITATIDHVTSNHPFQSRYCSLYKS